MIRKPYKVLQACKDDEIYLMNHCLASAGPDTKVADIRKLWGKYAYIIRCGQYLYLVLEEDYNYYRGD